MSKLRIHGSLDASPSGSDLAAALVGLELATKYSARIEAARAERPAHELDVADDDIVELELEDGVRLWTSVESLRHDAAPAEARAAAGQAPELPHALRLGPPSRGAGEWLIKGLKIFGVDVAGTITDFVKDKVEGKLKPGPGLYRCTAASATALQPLARSDSLAGDAPLLVFIHGTASSTESSFGALWEGGSRGRIGRLIESYQGRVLAFQHRTLSQSPIENALDLAQKLPAGARLHLVSHSRGGMVGELLCRGMREGRLPFDEADLRRFAAEERKRDREALGKLGEVLTKKQLRVERFVRVACPARGTTLADGRLDRYLSLLLNLIGMTGLKANPVYDGLATLLTGVIKKRTEPQELPGIEAMMPTSPLVAVLNRPDVRTAADLHVLGGDIEGSGVLGKLKVLATDLFYREDHDLVVNTPAMFGGAQRTGDIRYWIDQGGAVDHFSYFRNGDTAERLLAALLQPDTADFHILEGRPGEITLDDYRKRAAGPQPILLLLPGIMGSHLKVGDDRVWLDVLDLVAGGMERLDIAAANVAPDQPLGIAYGDLIRFLAASHQVEPFPYDWRDALDKAADRLRRRIDALLPGAEQADQPIRIMAHSMGGLVVRAMLCTAEGQATWQRMGKHPGARFVMLGTPSAGAHSIAAMLIGRDAMVRKLAMLDVHHDYGALLRIISRYPGVIQLLPDSGSLDLFDPVVWQRLHEQDVELARGLFGPGAASSKSTGVRWPQPEAKLLAQARALREKMRQVKLDADRSLYVAGVAPATPIDVRIDEAAEPGRRVIVEATEHGDGRVPWATGIPEELKRRVWYLDTKHGNLCDDEQAFPALLDLLNLGTTTKLPQTQPARRAPADERVVAPPEPPDMFPDENDLALAALGGTRRKTRRKLPRFKVRVVQGDLAHANSPVAVGHYHGDTIVSAESYLDRALDGRLRARHRLGLYPGLAGTAAVFLGDRVEGGGHPGALVIGLGQVGDLTPGGLVAGFTQAVLTYAAQRIEHCPAAGAEPILDLSVTTLLIGTGAGGLSIADSLQSLLRGVLQANRRLDALPTTDRSRDGKGQRTARIVTLDIIELYEDRAIQALKELLALAGTAEFRAQLEVEELLVESKGGRRRAWFEEDPAWWQRLRIAEDKDTGELRFEAITGRARAETLLRTTQRRLVERFLDDAVATTAADAELSYTLFEMLLPNRLKERAPDRRNLVLVLDEGSAAYPWELLHDRHDAGSRPLAVEAGMLRQLTGSVFRERVLAATEDRALVVGDPKNDDARFVPLPGAQTEAREVARKLRDANYKEVVSLIGDEATPRAVLTALHARAYRVMHLAAHGVFEFELEDDSAAEAKADPCRKRSTVSGMALGDGVFLTAAEIEQLRFVPDLVFINCCHLGQAKGEAAVRFHRLAANLATQLIRMGARAVVAAGWAVDDAAAKTFAQTFYDRFLGGRPFGDAVREAREEIYLKHRDVNTWGAYQCYGDPDFTLDKAGARRAARSEERMVAQAELRVELENIAEACASASDDELQRYRVRLAERTKGIPQAWLRSAALRSALGRAYGELGMFEEAIAHHEAAKQLQPADAPLRALEQLANLRARWAVQLYGKDRRKAQNLLDQAQTEIEQLLQLGVTPARHAAVGSLNKRRALLATSDTARRKALERMADAYRMAFAEASRPDSPNPAADDPYPLQNALAASVLLSWGEARRGRTTKAIEDELQRLEEMALARRESKSDFWSLCLEPDAQLLRQLARSSLDAGAVQSIVGAYRLARQRGASPHELRSALENLAFLEEMARHLAPERHRTEVVGGIAAIRQALE